MVETTGIRLSASSRSRMAGLIVGHVAHEAEVGVAHVGGDQAGVLAGQPDGQRAVHVDGRHDVAVHLADQHHPGDVERLGVGDPQTVAELGHLAEASHEVADLRAAAVHDDRADADRLQQHDVLGEAGGEVGIDHGVAAVLHHDGRAEEAPDVGQRLDQHAGPLGGRGQALVHGYTPTIGSPTVSSSPTMRLAHCTAWPDAPLTRLSMAHSAIT